MPANKRQHYVPKFLLKYFSVYENCKQINIYNIENSKLIYSASLKEQAAENYFYGQDGHLEEMFSNVETESSKIITNIFQNIIPKILSQEYIIILLFTLLLQARTLYKAEEQRELIKNFIGHFASSHPLLKDHLDEVEIEIKNPLSYILKSVALSYPLALDLNFKILKNATDIPFILSDNPTVFYNIFLEDKKKFGSNVGLASKGLQIFLPLNPKYLLMFYDSDVYSVGDKLKKNIILTSKKDITYLNSLQFLSANKNIYFNDWLDVSHLKELSDKFSKYLRNRKSRIEEFPAMDSCGNSQGVLMMTYSVDIKCEMNLSFVKILKKAKDYNLGNKTVHLRNEPLVRLHNQFCKLVDAKQYKISDFSRYIEDINLINK